MSKATPNTISVSDLVKNRKKNTEPKFLETLSFGQIDRKSIRSTAYSVAVEEAEQKDSFIAERDLDSNGLSKEHQQQLALIEEIEDRGIAIAEAEVEGAIAEGIKITKGIKELFSTTWSSEDNRTNIRTKYFNHPEHGIVVKELKETPTRETFSCAIPSLSGLRAFRAELSNNPELEDRLDELILIHNQHVLAVNGIESSDAEILADLAVIDETDSRRSVVDTIPSIWINFYDKLITTIKNDNLQPKAQKSQKRRDF